MVLFKFVAVEDAAVVVEKVEVAVTESVDCKVAGAVIVVVASVEVPATKLLVLVVVALVVEALEVRKLEVVPNKVAIVPNDFPEWNINQALAIFRPISGLLPEFINLSTNQDRASL